MNRKTLYCYGNVAKTKIMFVIKITVVYTYIFDLTAYIHSDARKNRMSNNYLPSNFIKQTLVVAVTVGFATLVTACGGGGSSNTTANNNPPVVTQPTISPTPATADPIATTPTTNPVPSTTNATTPEQAAFTLLNYNRTQCGFGAMTVNTALNITASNHANYLRTVSESNQLPFASHNEMTETYTNGTALVNTGAINPYYSGLTLSQRLNPTILGDSAVTTKYAYGSNVENLAMATLRTNATSYNVNKVARAEEMLRGLFAAPYHMQGLLHPAFKEVGISYQLAQWSNGGYNYYGNILELASAFPTGSQTVEPTQTLNFPCDNITTAYELNNESPNPFGTTRDLKTNPVGQPIYVRAPASKTIDFVSGSITANGQSVSNVHILTATNDPNKLLQPYEAVLIPLMPLQPSTTYQVTYQVRFSDGTTENKSFSFKTQAQAS